MISRSGNRMGQRQRKRILEQAQAKEGGVTWHSSNRTTGDKVAAMAMHGVKWFVCGKGTQQANATSTAPPSEKLHPSGCKEGDSAQGAIRAFEGNKTDLDMRMHIQDTPGLAMRRCPSQATVS